MSKKVQHITMLFLFLSFINMVGQEPKEQLNEEPKLVIKARATSAAILLRWGVTNKLAWKYGNEYGYSIERATISRNGQPLRNSEKIILSGAPIKPKPLAEWETLVQNNDMAAVVAQAIYGDNFSVNNDDESALMKVINQSGELEQRFGFSMFAVDQDFEAAQYAGLGFKDDTVKPNEKYLYNIRLAAPEELIQLKETGIFIGPSENVPLPKPYDFAGYTYNNSFVLIWEYDALVNFYTTYNLEKSEDGINFIKINETPITKLAVTGVSGISFTDSIPEYGKKYWYRIKGKTLFNEFSPPSDTITVIAYEELLAAPEFKKSTILSEKEVSLGWSFSTEEHWKLKKFELLLSNKAIGPFTTVEDNLSKDANAYTYSKLKDINYFKIRAHGIASDYKDSPPLMIQPVDSIPPAIPKGLIGTVDTLGVVKLSWTKNTELDLKGYALLRANRPNQEFTRLTKEELIENSFNDTINLKSFNEKVYYQLIAIDQRYNESPVSKVLVLNRPSKIPPTNPVFDKYEVAKEGVLLQWKTSSSDNIQKQIIYRKLVSVDENTQWLSIFETTDHKLNSYTDASVTTNQKYIYTIIALNSAGIESEPSPPITITTERTLLRPTIKGFYANVDREAKFIQLSWRYNETNIEEIQLYKKDNESAYSLYQIFNAEKKQFIDTQLSPNTTFSYGIKAIFTDGSVSRWSEFEVKY